MIVEKQISVKFETDEIVVLAYLARMGEAKIAEDCKTCATPLQLDEDAVVLAQKITRLNEFFGKKQFE